MIAAALGLAGFANLTADHDDFVRRQEIDRSPVNKSRRPAARAFFGPPRRRKVRRQAMPNWTMAS